MLLFDGQNVPAFQASFAVVSMYANEHHHHVHPQVNQSLS